MPHDTSTYPTWKKSAAPKPQPLRWPWPWDKVKPVLANNKKIGEKFSVLLLFGEKGLGYSTFPNYQKNSQNKKIDPK